MKRKLLMIMALAGMLTFTPSSSAMAAAPQALQAGSENEIQPQYVNTINIAASLKIEGSTAYAHSTVTAKQACHVSVIMRLQRWTGSEWHTVCSWVEASDNGTKTTTRSFALTTRGTYRVYTDFNVGGEALTYISKSKTY